MSTIYTNPSSTNLGNTVFEQLAASNTKDELADAQRTSGNHISKLEQDFAGAASLDNNPEEVSAWAKKNGYGDVKNQSALISMIQSKLDRSSQVFLTLQKVRDRAHDMMMEIIRSIGKM
jgi:hypothetical protein